MRNEFELLADFAIQHRLKTKSDSRNNPEELAVLGKHGQIYQYGDGELGVLFMPSKTARPSKWQKLRQSGVTAGMTIRQSGDTEGALSFDPADKIQAALAIKIAGARPKRQRTPEQVAAFLAATAKHRFKAFGHGTNGPF